MTLTSLFLSLGTALAAPADTRAPAPQDLALAATADQTHAKGKAGKAAGRATKDGKDKAVAGPDATDFSISGVYAIWGLNQRNFMLGADHPLDDADYIVHMLRLAPRFDRTSYGVVARMDLAQGWWGVDNSPNTESVESIDPATGVVSSSPTYNPYAMFRDKDTNYTVHVDHAYVWFLVPGLSIDVRVQAGRQYMGVGNKLVLDQDLDGITVNVAATDTVAVELLGAKVSEGIGSVKAPTGALMSDKKEFGDATLGGGRLLVSTSTMKAELFGLYYQDRSGDGTATFFPQGYGYFNSRFRPNVSMATALGLSAQGKAEVGEGLEWIVEGDYLMGTDEVNNRDFAGGLLDMNNGELSGWNAYASLDQNIDIGIPASLGATFGMGSGDDDVTSGRGNINKIQTMGFFGLTNVWEDSVMPDVGGISPQGLGSPVSRGYRELENTTAVQGRISFTPVKPLRLESSYTYLRATQPVPGFDLAGDPTGGSTQDLGAEVDVNAKLTITKGLSYAALFGIFLPGEAGSRLITGGIASNAPAWEVKHVLMAKF